MQNSAFKIRASKFIKGAISQRKAAIRTGKSHINPVQCTAIITKLETLMPSNTPQLARFIVARKDQILFILVGSDKRRAQLNALIDEAREITLKNALK